MVEKSEVVADQGEVMSAMTRKLLEIIDKADDYGLNIDQRLKITLSEIAAQNVFFDYERLERDEPEIEFDENAMQPGGLELKTTYESRLEGLC